MRAIKFRSNFHSLCFPTRECSSRLTKTKITQTNIVQTFEPIVNRRYIRKETECFFDSHFENIVDIFFIIFYFKSLFHKTLAVTNIARYINSRQKMHFNFNHAITLTSLASTSLNIEGKSICHPTARSSLRSFSKKFTDKSKSASISGGIGTRCPANR